MTEYNASDLLARLRADREGILATRQMLEETRLRGRDVSEEPEHHGPNSADNAKTGKAATNGSKAGVESSDAHQRVVAPEPATAEDLFADEEIEVIRAMRAKVERVDARLTSLQEWIAETRSWTERVELAQKAQRDLGRLVLESQARIDQQVKDAEERANRIVAVAEEQARQLLVAAERAAAQVSAASTPQGTDAGSEERGARATEVELSPEEAEAEQLYEAIELFTRTNAELVNELSALISTIPVRDHRH